MRIIGAAADVGLFGLDGQPVIGLQYIQYPAGLGNDFRADSVAG
jgi:hypothetical protein